ncbi:hypothetical protein diail_8345 [Diaporthe ilicicola]|nr:hypothetical protein diail_8345 [Diaporthe ilicicola]
MGIDGKTIRLRASCNACNESKVRCSQRKPTCARCERNGVECVYGLSRRTHKDAPPISMPPSQRPPRGPLRASSNSDMNNSSSNHGSKNSWGSLYFSKSGTVTPSTSTPNGGASPDRAMSAGISAHGAASTNLFGDSMSQLNPYTPTTPTAADPTHGSGLLLDFSSLPGLTSNSSSHHIDPLSGAVTQFSTPGAEYANPWAIGSLFGNSNSNNIATTTATSSNDGGPGTAAHASDMAAYLATPPSPPSLALPLGDYTCSCHAGVTELLTSMRGGGGDDRRLPIDAQLAKLKRCIASSEASMACAHGRDDAEPIHIMAIATLIGFVIDEFEMLASEAIVPFRTGSSAGQGAAAAAAATAAAMAGDMVVDSRGGGGGSMSSGSDEAMSMVAAATGASNMSLASFMEPRLSWGVLELEDDDEVDLRQRLYLLSFRKLERLLSQLTMYLRNLHDSRAALADPSRHMAFVMACDYTRLWLEKKAEDVKRLLSVSMGGDEIMDPALV